jgi:hypothetical protein
MLLIYKKLLLLFSYIKKPFTNQKEQPESFQNPIFSKNQGSLIFILENSTVLILINIPDTSNKTSGEIVDLAENYAHFILGISNNHMYSEIIDLLEKKMIEDDNISNKLFVENVLHFAPILKNELEKQTISSYINNTEPLIKPTSVFKYAIK